MGGPGAGKGTMSAKIVEKYNINHISTGDIFRSEIGNKTELGMLAKSYMDKGLLVPDEVTNKMVKSYLENLEDRKNGFLLDGFPRTTAQAEALDRILEKNGETATSVVSIMIPDEMIKDRIRHRASIEGRADDAKEETINNRIRTYHEKTEPLVEFYRNQGKYREIDGTGTIDQVRQAIFDLMDKF